MYFIQRAFKATLDLGLSVEQADAMLGRPIGLPKTGVFALMDLVGIDLIPHVTESLLHTFLMMTRSIKLLELERR